MSWSSFCFQNIFFHFQIIIRFEMFIVIIVSDLSPHCIDLLKIDRVTIGEFCDNLWQLSLIALISWKLTMWQLDNCVTICDNCLWLHWFVENWLCDNWSEASTQFSTWTLSFSSNFATLAEFLFKQDWIIIRQSAIDFIKICTGNIFPCARHVELTQKCWTEMNNIQFNTD